MTDLTALLTRLQEVEQAATPGPCEECGRDSDWRGHGGLMLRDLVEGSPRHAFVPARTAHPALIEVALAADALDAVHAWYCYTQKQPACLCGIKRIDDALTALTERLRSTLEGSGE